MYNPNLTQDEFNQLLEYLAGIDFTFIRIIPKGKTPDGKWGKPTDRISPSDVITRLSKGGNYGIVPPEGYFILDFDSEDAFQRSIAQESIIAESLTFKTPRGFHVLFQGEDVGQGASHTFLGQGVDVRAGNKGYIVGPGSTRDDGRYEYHSGDSIIEAPETLRKLLQKPDTTPTAVSKGGQTPSHGKPAGDKPLLKTCHNRVTESLAAMANAVPTQRNSTFNKQAYLIGSYTVHYPEQFDTDTLLARIREAVETTFTVDDSEAEKAKHFETAERSYHEGRENPHEKGSDKEKKTNEPSMFLNISQLMGYAGRYNAEKQVNEWHLPDGITGECKWRDMSKGELEWLLGMLWENHGWNVKSFEVNRLTAYVCRQNPVRPTFEYLKSCRVNPALADVTLENWLSPWLDNPDGELERWASKAMLVQIVSRIHCDPKPQRINVTLRGPGDTGKSTLIQNLLPEELDVTGDLNVGGSDRDIISQLTNGYIVEFSELAGLNRKAASSLKSLLGAGNKKMRKLYAEAASKRTYTAAIIGTTNLDPILYDDEALISRFVFVDFHRNDNCDPATYIPEIRDHIFALAYQAYQDGFQSNILPEYLKGKQFENAEISVNKDHLLNDYWSEVNWLQVPKRFRAREIAAYMGLAMTPAQFTRLKLHLLLPKFLRSKGFIVSKGKGGSEWWERPPSGEYPLPTEDLSQNNLDERRIRASKAYGERTVPLPLRRVVNIDDFDDL